MPARKRGFFITFEGLDGSGKSTQFKLLAARLRVEGFQVTTTREPGGDLLAEKIRTLLLERADQSPTPTAELLLFLAARAQHVERLIRPALAAGQVVLCDRFSDSTLAYQAGGRALPPAAVAAADKLATAGLKPDLTLLYDLPLRQGRERAFQAKQAHDRMESEPSAFWQAVRQAYRGLARREPRRIALIRSDRPLAAVTRQTWQVVQKKMAVMKERCRAV
ncbi:MAG: dTMP kinase [candidate division FCPU426 bacterium]